MLADTDRLNNLINNLLLAAKLEHRVRAAQYPVIDFSLFLGKILESKQSKLPEGGSITIEVEEGIKAAVDTERMATVVRNLFENACLYSPESPEIRVTLTKKRSVLPTHLPGSREGYRGKRVEKDLPDVLPGASFGREYPRHGTWTLYSQIGDQGSWRKDTCHQRRHGEGDDVPDHPAARQIVNSELIKLAQLFATGINHA